MHNKFSYLTSSTTKKYWFDACKLIYHQEKLQDFLDHKRISPVHMDIGIHKSCNIKCIYCYGEKQKPSPEYIPEDRLMMIVDDAIESGVKSIAIIGDGEPTMNKGLYPMVTYGKHRGLDMSVGTNGLLLDEAKIRMLCDSLVWLRFNVSATGHRYDWIHGAPKDSFDRFENIVKTAVKYKGDCTIGLQMVLIPQCFDQIIPLTHKALEWGVDYLVIKQFSDGGEGMPIHMDMASYEKAEEDLVMAEWMSTARTRIIVKWNAMKDTQAITSDKKWGFDRCIDLPFIFQVSGNGKCYPCGYLFGNEEYCYGDLRTERLAVILKSQKYWDVVAKVKKTPLEELCQGQCRHCETDKFMDRLTKVYTGDLRSALVKMCGGEEQYLKVMQNPPAHVNFV
jgi:MoaA/NifB/PqqE/SkfB family radical SAM enzyme